MVGRMGLVSIIDSWMKLKSVLEINIRKISCDPNMIDNGTFLLNVNRKVCRSWRDNLLGRNR